MDEVGPARPVKYISKAVNMATDMFVLSYLNDSTLAFNRPVSVHVDALDMLLNIFEGYGFDIVDEQTYGSDGYDKKITMKYLENPDLQIIVKRGRKGDYHKEFEVSLVGVV